MIFTFSTLEIASEQNLNMKIFSLVVLITTFLGAHPNKEGRSRRRTVLNLYCWIFSARQNVNPFACLFTENSSDFLLGGKSSEPLLSFFHYCFTNTQKKLSIFHALLGGRWTWSLLNYIFLLLFFFLLLLGANYFKYLYSISFLSLSLSSHSTTHTNYDSNKQRRSSLIIWVNTVNFTAFAFFLFN